MANTGFKQATIAYKVRKPTNEPLDINGQLTSVSGLRQAIALLVGTANPNPTLYEVETYFTASSPITGNPTIEYDINDCPIGYLLVLPSRIVLDPTNPTAVLFLISVGSWELEAPSPYATLNITSGMTGIYNITVTRTATLGQEIIYFKNSVSGVRVGVTIINEANLTAWILDTGQWDNLAFWFDDGIWNF